MVKINSYRYKYENRVFSKDLWYDVSNQTFYDASDKVFGTGITRNGIAVLDK